jgi:hypothetical protein
VDTAQADYPQRPTAGDEWWLPAHLGGTAPTVEQADELAERDRARRKEQRAKES